MDFSLLIYSGLGAAIGTLIGRILNKLHKSDKTKSRPYNVIFVIAGITILPLLYRNMYLPRIVPMGPSEFGEATPFYLALKEHDPKAYDKVIAPLDPLARKGDLSPEALQETRLVLDEILADKRKNTNLENLRKETELALWQYKTLKEKAPIVCVQKTHGRPFMNLSAVLSEDYINQEVALMVAYIKNPKRPENVDVDAEKGAKLFAEFLKSSTSELGSVDLDPSDKDVPAQAKVCELLIILHEKILNTSDQNIYDIYGHLNK